MKKYLCSERQNVNIGTSDMMKLRLINFCNQKVGLS